MSSTFAERVARLAGWLAVSVLAGCAGFSEPVPDSPPPTLKKFDAYVYVRIDSLRPQQRDEETYAYEAVTEILDLRKPHTFLRKGQTLTLDVEVPCVTVGKLEPGEEVALKLVAVPGDKTRFRLTPGGIVR